MAGLARDKVLQVPPLDPCNDLSSRRTMLEYYRVVVAVRPGDLLRSARGVEN